MNNRKIVILLFLSIVALCFSACNKETNFYVSPQGNDANPGSKLLSFASFNGAKNHVQKIKSSINGDVRLKPESPALKLGFVPIDLSKVGLRDRP